MKLILVGAVAALVIGLMAAGPVVLVLLVMIAPLLVLGMASGWALTHGGSGAAGRRQVVTPARRR